MLDGTSSDVSIEGRDDEGSLVGTVVADFPPRPAEPRREILYRRRIGLVGAIRELWAFRELTVTLAERDLRIRYKQAVLGLAWAVITPVAMMIAFSFIFQKFAHVKTGQAPFALFS